MLRRVLVLPHHRHHLPHLALHHVGPTVDPSALGIVEDGPRLRRGGEHRPVRATHCRLRGLEVRLRFDPWSLARIEVDYRGQSFGLARKVDRQLNSQLGAGTTHYEK